MRAGRLLVVLAMAVLVAAGSTTAFAEQKPLAADPRDEEIFSFEPEIIEENVAP